MDHSANFSETEGECRVGASLPTLLRHQESMSQSTPVSFIKTVEGAEVGRACWLLQDSRRVQGLLVSTSTSEVEGEHKSGAIISRESSSRPLLLWQNPFRLTDESPSHAL